MSYNKTKLLAKAEPVLHAFGYTVTDCAVLHAIANRENQKLRTDLEAEGAAFDDPRWRQTYCFAGAPRLAWDKNVSERGVRKTLKKAWNDGLLDVLKAAKANGTDFRRFNNQALTVLLRGLPEVRRQFLEGERVAKHSPSANLDYLAMLEQSEWLDCPSDLGDGCKWIDCRNSLQRDRMLASFLNAKHPGVLAFRGLRTEAQETRVGLMLCKATDDINAISDFVRTHPLCV